MPSATDLKRRIDAARTLRGLKQAELGERLHADGLGKYDLGRVERGEIPLTRVMIDALSRHLAVPPAWFEAEALAFESDEEAIRVIDPAAGSGAFLTAAVEDVRARLERIEGALESAAADYTRVATDEGRAATTAALESADVAGSTPPADSARDEADASPEDPRSPGQATRRTEPGAGG